MKFKYKSNFKLVPGIFQDCKVNSASIILGKEYTDVFNEMETLAKHKFGLDIKQNRLFPNEVFHVYMNMKNYLYTEVVNKEGKPELLKMVSQDLPTGFDYIAIVLFNERKKQSHSVCVIDDIINDKFNVSGKKVIGILFHKRHVSKLVSNWPGLMRVNDQVMTLDEKFPPKKKQIT